MTLFNTPYLFVYGTLKSDAINPNAAFLHQRAKWLGAAKWLGHLYQVTNYPAAIKTKTVDEYVHGELWELMYPEEVLAKLDEYEECSPQSPLPHEYQRSIEMIEIGETTVAAWIYLYQLSALPLQRIQSGLFENDNQVLIRRSLD